MHVRTITAATAALLLAIAGTTASAMPQQEFADWKQGYTDARTKLFSSGSATRDSFNAMVQEHLDKLDFAALTPAQAAEVEGIGLLQAMTPESNPEVFDALQGVIAPALDDKGAEGLAAVSLRAILKLTYGVGDMDADKALAAALRHPALADAMKDTDRAGGLSSLMYAYAHRASKEVRAELAPQMLAMRKVIDTGVAPGALMPMEAVYDALAANAGKEHEAEVEKFRLATMAQVDSAITDDSLEPPMKNSLRQMRDRLDAAPRIAKLVGSPAPELSFTWSNTEQPIASLADLRGKVVVLDFWATWCGPCVSSFPNIKELQSFYEGFPVVIVGVTSPQGSVISKSKGSIKAESPEHEYELMADYIDEMAISWTIAFSSQPVFNPEYGIRGIPHVAIIDPEGVLRYRGLHPAHPMATKVEKINGLLKEFGLPAPDDTEIKAKAAKPTG